MQDRSAIVTSVLTLAVLLAGCASNRPPVVSTPPTPAPKPAEIRVNASAPNEIPAGTKVEVRTNEVITSTSTSGKTYSAQIATDVVALDGAMLLPRGAPVELVLMETKQGKGIRGSSVALGMRSVTVQGATYLVVSEEVERNTGLGANKRTAQTVGTGAALGTLIGAAAGGGKGAVIGGLAGAAAGALAQVLTQNKELKIPAETVLAFQLDEPIRLEASAAPPASAPPPGGGWPAATKPTT
ncbi:MAG: hypothetical protein SGI92_03350 [Bryobacteraceae bacterium]|nr:hypothetical protein [Bryobacteraceae bacterium]